ncbi:hypothetical protein NHX12_007590 [Muraenolepis orangiensis]|uniref:Uncharacterized protein n=1 Tax=Muraenolepis orangiensis TaxID=630683 RepID=A0A9Q0DQ93_9TELE|nr:hypothetical protein NHX12_007590 [Muraenolepis orangiensis]
MEYNFHREIPKQIPVLSSEMEWRGGEGRRGGEDVQVSTCPSERRTPVSWHGDICSRGTARGICSADRGARRVALGNGVPGPGLGIGLRGARRGVVDDREMRCV